MILKAMPQKINLIRNKLYNIIDLYNFNDITDMLKVC